MSAAASRPGIDPRSWISYAVVEELGYDPVHGVFADVRLQPTGEPETVYIGSPYAGNDGGAEGFGSWYPLEVGDTVLVAQPGGDSSWGPVIFQRLWTNGDPPPSPADLDWAPRAAQLEPPTDVVIRAKPGVAYKVRTKRAELSLRVEETGDLTLTNLGTGNVTVEALGAGKVKLGVAATASPLMLATPFQAALTAASTAVGAVSATDTVLQSAIVAAFTALSQAPVGTIKTEAT